MFFACDKCQTVDSIEFAQPQVRGKYLCSNCLPGSTWHGYFPKAPYRPGVDIVCNRISGIGLGTTDSA